MEYLVYTLAALGALFLFAALLARSPSGTRDSRLLNDDALPPVAWRVLALVSGLILGSYTGERGESKWIGALSSFGYTFVLLLFAASYVDLIPRKGQAGARSPSLDLFSTCASVAVGLATGIYVAREFRSPESGYVLGLAALFFFRNWTELLIGLTGLSPLARRRPAKAERGAKVLPARKARGKQKKAA